MKTARLFLFLAFACISMAAFAQNSESARFNIYLDIPEGAKVGDEAYLIFEVEPKAGWHVYSAIPSAEGAYKHAELGWEVTSIGFEAIGGLEEKGKLIEKYDEIMEGTARYYKDPVVYKQKIKLTEAEITVAGYMDYMACNEYQCIPFTADFELKAKLQ